MTITTNSEEPAGENHEQENDTSAHTEPEILAQKAEKAHQKVTVLEGRQLKLGQEQIKALIQAGELLLEAKVAVGHTKFTKELQRWREAGIITFSDRSARRYMLVGKHAGEIKSATVASLREAEQMAAALEKEGRNTKARTGTATGEEPPSLAEVIENQVLKAMSRIKDLEQQRMFLGEVIEKLTSRMRLL